MLMTKNGLSVAHVILLTSFAVLVSTENVCRLPFQQESRESGCYYIGTNEVDWYTASNECNAIKGELVTIESEAKQEDLNNFLTKFAGERHRAWTGGYGNSQTMVWKSTGEDITYQFFQLWGENSNLKDSGIGCIGLGKTRKWNIWDCKDNKIHYVCEPTGNIGKGRSTPVRPPQTTQIQSEVAITEAPKPTQCHPPYVGTDALGCYYFSTDQLTWPTARDFCKDIDGRLVTLTSKRKADNVNNVLARYNRDDDVDWWIGAFGDGEKITWLGSSISLLKYNYKNWAMNEPPEGTKHGCVGLGTKKQWYLWACMLNKLNYICEHIEHSTSNVHAGNKVLRHHGAGLAGRFPVKQKIVENGSFRVDPRRLG